jgi:hypothetical protein
MLANFHRKLISFRQMQVNFHRKFSFRQMLVNFHRKVINF